MSSPNSDDSSWLRTAGKILFDVVYLIFGLTWAYTEPIYRLFVPVPMKNLDNEVILVTGAGNGMGKEMCLYLARCCPKTTLVCWDLNQQDNDKVVGQLRSMGVKATGYQIDVTNRQKIEQLATQVKKEVGDVTVVVNNAGIMPTTDSFLQLNPNEFERIYQVNVFSHYWILRQFLPKMIERNHGHILTMSSLAGLVPSKHSSIYCGSKHAVHGFVETLRLELRAQKTNNIHFTTVYPSVVNTALVKDCEMHERYPSPVPVLEPAEAAREIIDSFRRNEGYVYLPRYYSRLLVYLNSTLLPKVVLTLRDIFDIHLTRRSDSRAGMNPWNPKESAVKSQDRSNKQKA